MSTIFPVILSGGSGTRLWPLSRAMYPKQFIRFFNDQNDTFLTAALMRLKETSGFAPPILLCNNDHRFLVRAEVDGAGVTPKAIILEPVARNTAPAITVAALLALQHNPDAILAVMPSDHIVKDEARFAEAVMRAAKVAASGTLVLFGVTPAEAHTGYGYIERGTALPGFDGTAYAVASFAEKPDRATAEAYLAAGTHFWNSGIFVLNAKTYLEEIERLEPRIAEAARAALADATDDLGFLRLEKTGFAASPNISIDYAVM
jgi:mannose-1-phosphate guanylyltransferase/mannose-6-phosphate isomerase